MNLSTVNYLRKYRQTIPVLLQVVILLTITNIAGAQSFFKLAASKSLNANYFRDIIQTSDGGYVMAGGSAMQGDNVFDKARGFIVKLNASGDTSWTKRFESGSQLWNGLVPTSDGNFLAVGGYSLNAVVPNLQKGSIVKFNNAGNIIWQKRPMTNPFFELNAFIFSCGILAKDGSNVLVGSSGGLSSTNFAGVYFTKINSVGTFTAINVISPGLDSINLLPASVKELSGGGFIITGLSTVNENDIFVMRLDANGALVWAKTFGGTDNDTGADVIETSDGGFLVAGSTASAGAGESDFLLTKLDANGNKVWSKTYGNLGNEFAYSMIPYENGNYLIAGISNSYKSLYYDNYFLVVDGNGNVQESKRVPDNAGPEVTFTHPQIIKNTEGAYVLGGNFVANDADGNPSIDFGILKFEADFNSCAGVFDAAHIENSGLEFYTSTFKTFANVGTTTNLSTTISSGGTTTTICSNIPVTNIKSGKWSEPATWSTNKVPVVTDKVVLNYDVIVDIKADCWSLKTNNHQVHVNTNIVLTVHGN